jgi:hypothetical protein
MMHKVTNCAITWTFTIHTLVVLLICLRHEILASAFRWSVIYCVRNRANFTIVFGTLRFSSASLKIELHHTLHKCFV